MKRRTLVLAALALLTACPAEPVSEQLDVQKEPAGPNCPQGGLRVQVTPAGTPAYVCNGAEAQPVTTTSEPVGSNCASGGVKVSVGAHVAYVCNGSSGTTQAMKLTAEPAGSQCAAGGVKLQLGDEAPAYVCNGTEGGVGASAAVTPEPAGLNCQAGGVKVQVGSAPASYVCSGVPGTPGSPGTPGTPGTPGNPGESVTMTPEPPGAHCLAGGVKLQVGSGAPSDLCNGAPGPGIAWEEISVSTTALPNHGYSCNGAGELELNLPATTVVGDEVRVVARSAS